MRNHLLLATVTAAMLVLALPASAAKPPLQVAVRTDGVSVSGVTPGGDVVLFWYTKTSRGGVMHSDAHAMLLHDEDRRGVVSLQAPVPLRSVWVAVDAGDGTAGYGALPQFPLVTAAIDQAIFRKDAEGEIASMVQEIPRLAVLLVRPANGAWMVRGRDGDLNDRDGAANGTLEIAFEDTVSIVDAKKKGPKHLKAGDVIAAIDPGHLTIFIGQVTK